MESGSGASQAAGGAPGVGKQPSPSAVEVEAHVQVAFRICRLAKALPDLAPEGRTLDEVKSENEEIAKLLEQVRCAQQTTSELLVKVKEQRNEGARAGYKKNYCPSEEMLASIQKLIQANERNQIQLEKTLKRISDPQYVIRLATRLQKLDAAITRLRRENRRKDSENRRTGKFLEGEEKGAESLATQLLRELDHLSQEISIQKDKNGQLKEAVQKSESQLAALKDRHDLLREKHEEVARLLESQNMDIHACQLVPRRDSKEMHEYEDVIASLHRKIETLTLQRATIHRDHARQAKNLQRHVTILTRKLESLTQQQTVLKMEANRLSHQIHEQVTGLPEARKASASSLSSSYANVLPRVYDAPSGGGTKLSAFSSRIAKGPSNSRSKSLPCKNNKRLHPQKNGRSGSGTADTTSFLAVRRRRTSSSQKATKVELKRRTKTGSITLGNLPSSTCGAAANDADEDAVEGPLQRDLKDFEDPSFLDQEDDSGPTVLEVSAEAAKCSEEVQNRVQNLVPDEDTVESRNETTVGNDSDSSIDLHRLAREIVEKLERGAIYSGSEEANDQEKRLPETCDSGCVQESEAVVRLGDSKPTSRTKSFGEPPAGVPPEFSENFGYLESPLSLPTTLDE